MVEDFIYAGFRFKIKVLNKNEYLVSMVKENQMVEKFIAPINNDITYYIQNYLNIFYSETVLNTTRQVKNS